jgi:hypothetical protein
MTSELNLTFWQAGKKESNATQRCFVCNHIVMSKAKGNAMAHAMAHRLSFDCTAMAH